MRRLTTILCVTVLLLGACREQALTLETALDRVVAEAAGRDLELEICQSRIAKERAKPDLGGAPAYDEHRAEFLGRAAGEPLVLVSPPPPALVEPGQAASGSLRAARLASRYRLDKPGLRARVLRGGYLYADDPLEAFGLVKDLTLTDLFDEPSIWLQRGDETDRLERRKSLYERGFDYQYVDGPLKDEPAKLLFGDRVALERASLAEPLHRDVRGLRDRTGFDRLRLLHRGKDALVAELRFGNRWVEALLESDGAHLELACLAAPAEERQAVRDEVEATAPRRRAVAALRQAVTAMALERLPFDRPRGAKDHLSDGQLRPQWNLAYKRGQVGFGYEEQGYSVFDRRGRPYPPQMCVEFILDSYERATGTWYRPLGQGPERVVGKLDFYAHGILNRSGVLAFEKFAQSKPELFETSRFEADERIPFRDRERFFAFLVEHADRFRPGDVVAIQGPKRDGYIHQHAILIEDVDPLSGFPYGLADHMRHPRRRTWEGIMAEAPLRALLYQVRPKPSMLLLLDPESPARPAESHPVASTQPG